MYKLDKDMGYLLGLIAGDGSIVNKTIYLANVEKNIINEYKRIVKKYTNNAMRSYANPHEFKGYSCYSESHRFYVPALAKFIEENIGKGCLNKHVPEPIDDINFSIGILSGIWDSDGAITINRNRKKPQGQVSLTSRSNLLVNSVKLHLHKIGCLTSTYVYERGGKPLYIISVLSRYIKLFAETVDMKHYERKLRLEEIAAFPIKLSQAK